MTTEPGFEWVPEHDGQLERIASTDTVDAEWPLLRNIIKHKLEKNVSLYMSQSNGQVPVIPTITTPQHLPSGGLKLPPFPPRPRDPHNLNEAPRSILTQEEAGSMKQAIFAQLDELDGAPFTIQRVCELLLHPQKHYKFIGKYLRAVEKSLLVTSTWDAFPVSMTGESSRSATVPITVTIGARSSAPPTPMFSPIPFLHDDARRSASRSPPPSPLVLPALAIGASVSTASVGSAGSEPKALGLVDELDDPSPGHLSDHPQALTATTSLASKPLGTLDDRFIKSSGSEEDKENTATAASNEEMVIDDPEKENRAS